jgi:hypothetical protein
MIRKLKSGEFRLYSRNKDAKSGKRKKSGNILVFGGKRKNMNAPYSTSSARKRVLTMAAARL